MAAGGTPLKVLFEILGINEAKTGITSLVPEVQKVGAAADTAGQKVGTMAGQVAKTGQSGSVLAPVAQNMDKIKGSAEGAAVSATKLGLNTDRAKSSVEGLGAATSTAGTNVDKLVSQEEELVGTGARVTRAQDQVAGSSKDVATSTSLTSSAVDKTKTSQEGLATSSTKTAGSLDKEKTSIKAVGDEAVTGGGKMKTLNTETDKNTDSTTKANSSQTTLKTSFLSSMGAVASLGGGITQLWSSYDSLGDAQLGVDKATLKLNMSQEAADKIQTKINQLVAEGKTGSEEYQAAQLDLEQANSKVEIAQGNLANSQEDLNTTTAEFYQNIVPQVITVLGSMTTLVANSSGMLGKFKSALGSVSLESIKMSGTFKLISLSNPLFIAITVGAGILTLFATNLFGVRDAINGLGVAIGNAIGPLKPFLAMIGDLGQGLVNMLGQGGDAQKAFAETTESSMDMAASATETGMTTATGAVAGHTKSLKNWGADMFTITRDSNGVITGFTTKFGEDMNTAGNSAAELPKNVKYATDATGEELDKLLKTGKDTVEQMKKIFSEKIEFQGATLTGLTKKQKDQSEDHEAGTGVEGDRSIGEGTTKKLSDLGLDLLVIDGDKAYYSIERLKAIITEFGFNNAQASSLVKILNTDLKAQGIEGTLDASGMTNLQNSMKPLPVVAAATDAATKKLTTTTAAATGITAGFTSEAGKAAAANIAGGDASAKATEGYTKLTGMITATGKEFTGYTEILNSTTAMQDIAEEGALRQQAAYAKGMVELQGNISATAEYASQLNTTAGASLEFGTGVQKMADELLSAKAAALQDMGALYLLSDATVMSEAKAVASAAGYLKQEVALKKQQIATEGVKGETLALADQWARGEAQTTAYNKGLAEQEKKFQLDKVAGEEMRGTLKGMMNEWASGEAATLGYNKGLTEQAIQFENDKIAVAETKGKVAELRQEWTSGVGQVVAFNTGIQNQALAFEEDKKKLRETQGILKEMKAEWASGEAQAFAFNQGLEDQRTKLEKDKLEVYALRGEFKGIVEGMKSGEAQTTAYSKGVVDQAIAFENAKLKVHEMNGELSVLQARWESGAASTLAYNEGLKKQRITTEENKTANDTLIGTLQGLKEEWLDSETKLRSFDKGMIQQEIAFMNSQKAALENKGMLAQVRNEWELGETQALAMSEAVTAQEMVFENNRKAVVAAVETFKTLQTQLKNVKTGQVEFLKGFIDQQIATENSKLSIKNLSGELAAYTISTYKGEQGEIAFKEALLQANMASQQGINAVAGLAGGLTALQQNFDSDLIVAYATGLLEAKKATIDMATETANLLGQTVNLINSLTNSQDIMYRYNKGFFEGYDAMANWAAGLDVAKGSADASLTSFGEMADTMGVTLPAGFNLSIDQAKTWAEIMKGVPGTINEIKGQIDSASEGMLEGLLDAFREGPDELDDAIAEMGEKVGIEVTEAMRDGLKPGLVAQNLQEQLGVGMNFLNSSIQSGNMQGIQESGDSMIKSVNKAIEESPELTQTGQTLINALNKVKMNPSDWNVTVLQQAINTFAQSAGGAIVPANQLAAATGGLGGTLKGMSGPMSTSAQNSTLYNQALNELSGSMGGLAKEGKGLSPLLADQSSLYKDVTTNAKGLPVVLGAAADKTGDWASATDGLNTPLSLAKGNLDLLSQAADTSTTSMDNTTGATEGVGTATGDAASPTDDLKLAFENLGKQGVLLVTALKALPGGIKYTVDLMNIEFDKLNPIGPLFASKWDFMVEKIRGFPAEITTMTTNSNAAFNILNPMQQTYVTSWDTIVKEIGLLPGAILQKMTESNTAFNTLNPMQQTYVASWGMIVQQIGLLPGAVAEQVGKSNLAFDQLNPIGANYITKTQSLATSLLAFPIAITAVVDASNIEFDKLNPVGTNYMAKINSLATSLLNFPAAITAVVDSANIEFDKLNPIGANYTAKIKSFATSLIVWPDAVKAVVDSSNKEFDKLNPIGSGYITKAKSLATSLIVWPNAVKAVVDSSNKEFDKLNPVGQAYMTRVKSLAASWTAFPNAVKAVVNSSNTVWSGMGSTLPAATTKMQSVANTAFKAISNLAVAEARRIAPPFTQAASAVGSALSNMQSRASTAFRSIASSASGAVGGVRSLISAINALRSKSITLTTVHRNVYQTVYAAKGFGPSVIDSPLNMTVGEAGPELVSVIPLNNASSTTNAMGMHSMQSKTFNAGRVGGSDSSGGGIGNANGRSMNTARSSAHSALAANTSISDNSNINNTTLNRFNESVAKITNTFERQENVINSKVTTGINSINSVRGGSSINNVGGDAVTTNNSNSTAIPTMGTIGGGGSVYNSYGGTGGGVSREIVDAIRQALKEERANTTINLSNITNIDGDKVYDGQKKQFGLKNGSVLK